MSSNFDLGSIISNGCLGNVFSNDVDNLKIAHINAQSLRPSNRSHKLDELHCILRSSSIDILCVTETWLDDTVLDRAVCLPGYVLCRSDRQSGARGGGVAIYIAEGIKFKCVFKCIEFSGCEGLFLELPLGSDSLLLGVVYLPRGDLAAFDLSLSDLLIRYTNVVIVGDFNNNLFDMTKSHSVHMFCRRLALKCHHNFMPTHFDSFHGSTSLIDYFMLSQNIMVHTSTQFQLPFVSHHSLICASFSMAVYRADHVDYFRDFNNIDRIGVENYFLHLDFSPLYQTGDSNVMFSFFNKIFDDLMQFVPLRRVSRHGQHSSLRFTNHINYYRSLTALALRDFYRDRSAAKWEVYRRLRNRTKSLIRSLKVRHGRRVFEGCSTRQMWNVLRSVGAVTDSLSNVELDVNELNEHFLGNQLNSIDVAPDFDIVYNVNNSFSFENITEYELFKSVCKIKSKSIGADGLSIILLKVIYPFISRHLLHWVNIILTSSVFPAAWKVSKIVPIPKVKGCMTIANMRPISILSTISKVVENIMKEQMMSFLNRNRLLNDSQYGFRPGRNTSHLLTVLTDTIRTGLNNSQISVLVSIDLSKAFDQVRHSSLVNKLLTRYNFSISACRLIWSYLCDRSQYVSLNGLSSELRCVRSGVPQGSVLGPLLFTIFINNFFDHLAERECSALAYADDIQLLWTNSCLDVGRFESIVNSDLTVVHNWMVNNHLHVNPNKTKALIFASNSHRQLSLNIKISDSVIDIVGSHRCLGVIIDDKLSFAQHIDDITSKVLLTLRRLYGLNMCLPLQVKKSVTNALIMSRINYCLEVYSGCNLGNRDKIESLIRKTVRFVYGLRTRANVSCYLKRYLNLVFEDYLKFRLLIYLFKIIKFQCPVNLVQMISFNRSLRNPQLLIPRIFNRVFEQSFVVRVARLWNTLPSQLRSFSFSIPMFKRMIANVYSSNYDN